MERETGIEPATFSLGMWRSPDLVLAIENTGISESAILQQSNRAEMEQTDF
jgi:hypothetical protein